MRFASISNEIMFYVFISLFGLFSLINVIAAFFEKEKIRHISKPFCLLFLGASIISASLDFWILGLGCFFGSLGDLLLLYKEKKPLLLGGLVSFFVGHCLYIARALIYFNSLNLLRLPEFLYGSLAIFLVFYCLACQILYKVTRKSKVFTFGGALYATVLLLVLSTSILGCALGLGRFYAISVAGSALFIASDTFLTFTIFGHDVKRRDFYIMVPYLLGEAGITLGILFTALI